MTFFLPFRSDCQARGDNIALTFEQCRNKPFERYRYVHNIHLDILSRYILTQKSLVLLEQLIFKATFMPIYPEEIRIVMSYQDADFIAAPYL